MLDYCCRQGNGPGPGMVFTASNLPDVVHCRHCDLRPDFINMVGMEIETAVATVRTGTVRYFAADCFCNYPSCASQSCGWISWLAIGNGIDKFHSGTRRYRIGWNIRSDGYISRYKASRQNHRFLMSPFYQVFQLYSQRRR